MKTHCTCAPHCDGPQGECPSCVAWERERLEAWHERRERDLEAANMTSREAAGLDDAFD